MLSTATAAQEYHPNLPASDPAIAYAQRPADDRVATLAERLQRGAASLDVRSGPLGTLPALLDHLGINPDSQMLVFSKTSFQAPLIAPSRPRAIYFGDDVTVAYVPGAATVEIEAVDPAQGPIFYTMPIGASGAAPHATRPDVCLRCHQGPNTAGVPGIYVGSVVPGPTGAPLRDDSAIITDHRSAFAERWGGWYVTARRGEQRDRANAVATDPADPATLVRDAQQNLTSLSGFFDPSPYLTGTSDIVALMTFEHQTQMTNLITRVAWDAKLAGRDGQGSGALDADVEELLEYLLFSGEAPLASPIEGVSTFTRTFAQRGPRDRRGRSLRDFDLERRLFKYPLSFMIYSAQFDALPAPVRADIYRRLRRVLSGSDRGRPFAHLAAADRRAIAEILADTKSDWRQPAAAR